MIQALTAKAKSRQDVMTPRDLVRFVDQRFGGRDLDLAATAESAICENFISPEEDSLSVTWRNRGKKAWLNPPFANIRPWLVKCVQESSVDFEIVVLIPCSLDAGWFWDYINLKRCTVYPLRGRISFPGYFDKNGNPQSAGQGHMLVHYHGGSWGGIIPMDWKNER